MNIIRTTNPNGTYRYTVDGKVQYKASKVFYTHVSTFANVQAIQFHKTEAAALRNKGYTGEGWIKEGVVAIIDGDTPAPAPATPASAASAPMTDECGFCTSHPPYTPGDKIPANACAHWTTAETVDQRINRYQLEGNEAAAIALSDRPSDLAAIDRAIEAGARWSRRTSERCYALALPGKLETLALIHDDDTVDLGSTLDAFRPGS